jgi:hypothetical protein
MEILAPVRKTFGDASLAMVRTVSLRGLTGFLGEPLQNLLIFAPFSI